MFMNTNLTMQIYLLCIGITSNRNVEIDYVEVMIMDLEIIRIIVHR